MEIFLTHSTALEYWRSQSSTVVVSDRRQRKAQAPTSPPTMRLLSAANLSGMSLPLHVSVLSRGVKRASRMVKTHIISQPLVEGCAIDVGKGLYVASPELCLLQMANELPYAKLIELGLEFCGDYALYTQENTGEIKNTFANRDSFYQDIHNEDPDLYRDGFYYRNQLTNLKKLAAFVDRAVGMQGRPRMQSALNHINDGSYSPMETILTIMLTLPYKLGGYKLPMPVLNHRVDLSHSARYNTSRSYLVCDLFWPDARVAVEYDSDRHHTGAERIASDAIRRNTLAAMGIQVITVTRRQLRDINEFEKVARLLAAYLGKRLLHKRNNGFMQAQRQLRNQLL